MSDLVERFLAARAARQVSIRTAATESGVYTSAIIVMNRTGEISERHAQMLEEWIAAPHDSDEPFNPDEKWRPVLNYETEYEVSDHGNVRSLARKVKHPQGLAQLLAQPIRQHPNSKSGHMMVSLCRDAHCVKRYVHQLVLEAFVGPMPDGKEGCHNDGNPANNHVSNLRWDTRAGNMQDAVKHQTMYQMANWKGRSVA
jgi:hypothetical protein